ncbi:hypothetical protein BJ742DRAFT_85386 [Cladochytrium replicatum]|nr:hypothetical protein BJ742DRAFT_85386 [Cladochytrium replicatum]
MHHNHHHHHFHSTPSDSSSSLNPLAHFPSYSSAPSTLFDPQPALPLPFKLPNTPPPPQLDYFAYSNNRPSSAPSLARSDSSATVAAQDDFFSYSSAHHHLMNDSKLSTDHLDTQVNLLASDLGQLRDRFQAGSATPARISTPSTYSNSHPPVPPHDYNSPASSLPSSVLSLDRANPASSPDRSFDRISAPPGPRSSPFQSSLSPTENTQFSENSLRRWSSALNAPKVTWNELYPHYASPARTPNEAKLYWKVIHRRLQVNHYLKPKSETATAQEAAAERACKRCRLKQEETIEHALFDCPSSRHFWANLSAFLPIMFPGFGGEGYRITLADAVFFFPNLRTRMNRNDLHALTVIHSVALWALWGSRGAGTGGASPVNMAWTFFLSRIQARISLEFEAALSAQNPSPLPNNGRTPSLARSSSLSGSTLAADEFGDSGGNAMDNFVARWCGGGIVGVVQPQQMMGGVEGLQNLLPMLGQRPSVRFGFSELAQGLAEVPEGVEIGDGAMAGEMPTLARLADERR